jgi:hypothetical protein
MKEIKLELEIFKFEEIKPDFDRVVITFDSNGEFIDEVTYIDEGIICKPTYWAYAPKLNYERFTDAGKTLESTKEDEEKKNREWYLELVKLDFRDALKNVIKYGSELSFDEMIETFNTIINENETGNIFEPLVFEKIRDVFIREFNLVDNNK